MSDERWGIFERFGVELEYMIVDARTLSAMPIADRILEDADGRPQSEIAVGPLAWSNELVLHLLEMKTDEPATTLHGLTATFQASIAEANTRFAPYGALLMPSGMHPRMDPAREMKLWPHDYGPVYRAFDRIFDCRGHGWANLQSAHINLPFRDDAEFRRLHAAVRTVLPILPALAASSPIKDGCVTGLMDTRLEVYRHNAGRVPSVSGLVVPEPVDSEGEYRNSILARIYADLEPLDPAGILREEWVNARGAIARFDRGTIEIRVLDVQECAVADLAIAAAATAAIRMLADEVSASVVMLNSLATERLVAVLDACIADGEAAVVDDRAFLDSFGWRRGACLARDLWDYVIEQGLDDGPDRQQWERALEVILSEGCLARRLLQRIGADVGPHSIDATFRTLTRCLAHGRQLRSRPGLDD